jgi:hypothetical protein
VTGAAPTPSRASAANNLRVMILSPTPDRALFGRTAHVNRFPVMVAAL